MLIVCSTKDHNIAGLMGSSKGKSLHMMQLQHPCLIATTTIRCPIRAAHPITVVHLAFDFAGNVPGLFFVFLGTDWSRGRLHFFVRYAAAQRCELAVRLAPQRISFFNRVDE